MLSLYRVPLNEIQSVWKLHADHNAAIKATLVYTFVRYDIMIRKFYVYRTKCNFHDAYKIIFINLTACGFTALFLLSAKQCYT